MYQVRVRTHEDDWLATAIGDCFDKIPLLQVPWDAVNLLLVPFSRIDGHILCSPRGNDIFSSRGQ
jgi:hypothetical protein